jgi:hypothetical protein
MQILKPSIFGAVGLALIVIGAVGVETARSRSNLASMVVSKPGPAMVPTAIGSGGTDPTTVLPGADGAKGILASGVVPTTPTLFLKPSSLTFAGRRTVAEGAYWEVWWDPSTQIKAVVSLQQHTSSLAAAAALSHLVARNSDAGNFTSTDFRVTGVSSFPVSGVPGATGLVWDGSEGSASNPLPIDFRFAVFRRDSVVALVSMTAYARKTDAAAFLASVQSQYSMMSAAPAISNGFLFQFILIGGIGLLIVGGILLFASRRPPMPGPPASRGGQMWGPVGLPRVTSGPAAPPPPGPVPSEGPGPAAPPTFALQTSLDHSRNT